MTRSLIIGASLVLAISVRAELTSMRDVALFRASIPRNESVVFVLAADELSGMPVGMDAHSSPELSRSSVLDLMRRDLGVAAAEFDDRGARSGLVVTGPVPDSDACQAVLAPFAPTLGQWGSMSTAIGEYKPAGKSDFVHSMKKAIELLKSAPTPKRRIVVYARCGNACGLDPETNAITLLDELRAALNPVRIDVRMYGVDAGQEKTLKELASSTGGSYENHKLEGCNTRPDRPGRQAHPHPVKSPVTVEFIPVVAPSWPVPPDPPRSESSGGATQAAPGPKRRYMPAEGTGGDAGAGSSSGSYSGPKSSRSPYEAGAAR